VQPDAGGFAFSIRADDVAISDLAITGGATGVNFQSVPSDNAQLSRIDFSSSTSRGIDISTTQTITGVAIDDCTFTAVNTGVRMSSNSVVNGLTITNSTFNANAYGLYQANDGNQSTLTGLTIADCAFTNNTQYAIDAEELRDAAIEDSTFTNNRVAISRMPPPAPCRPARRSARAATRSPASAARRSPARRSSRPIRARGARSRPRATSTRTHSAAPTASARRC
jgi:hypothetical protein